MRVKCIRIRNPVTREPKRTSSWLTVGKEYAVLTISAVVDNKILFRCLSDDGGGPVCFESDQFITVCSSMPSNWIASLHESGSLEIGPSLWSREGFWEDYFNDVAEAMVDFDNEVARMTQAPNTRH